MRVSHPRTIVQSMSRLWSTRYLRRKRNDHGTYKINNPTTCTDTDLDLAADFGCVHTTTSMASKGPQVIKIQGVDEWALFLELEKNFGLHGFRINQKSDRYEIWAPQDIGELKKGNASHESRHDGHITTKPSPLALTNDSESRGGTPQLDQNPKPNNQQSMYGPVPTSVSDPDTVEVNSSRHTSLSSVPIDFSLIGTHLRTPATPLGNDEDLEISLSGPQPPQQSALPRHSSSGLQVPKTPKVKQSNTTITDSGPKSCVDGGRYYESLYLRNRLTLRTGFHDMPETLPLLRRYSGRKSVLRQVLVDLTGDDTVVQSAMNPKSAFVPCTILHDIMSFETVKLILQECFSEALWTTKDVQRIAPKDMNTTGLRRIFAILIIIQKHSDILSLLSFDSNIDDSYLMALDDTGTRSNATYGQEQLEAFFVQQDWLPVEKKAFRRTQWEVSPIFFANEGGHDVHYQCRSGDILPLIEHSNGIHKQGGYGEVTSYLLHESQQSLKRYTTNGPKHPVVVKKPYRLVSRDDFDKEIDVLRRLTRSRRGRNQHLAKLLATFEVPKSTSMNAGTDYYMMFECADTTLDDLFKDEPKSFAKQPDLHEWAARQIYGLATALRAMHRLKKGPDDSNEKTRGIHGDLKPLNILVYRNWNYPEDSEEEMRPDPDSSDEEPDPQSTSEESDPQKHFEGLGVLQITDFGRSSFHHTLTVEDIKFTTLGGDYCPPELQLKLSVSPSLDIWTLGCLYLEILTWILEGPQGIERFREKRDATPGFLMDYHRCFYSVHGKKEDQGTYISVSSAVLEWATHLYKSKHGSDFTRNLLKLILGRMLVIEDKKSQGRKSRNFESVPDQRSGTTSKGRNRQKVDADMYGSPANHVSTRDFVQETNFTSEGVVDIRQINRIPAKELVTELYEIRNGQGAGYYKSSPVKEDHDFFLLPRNAIFSPNSYTELIKEMKAEDARKK
ncbi:protein kinase-like (pk-like) [Colletotrichum incanum]|uniref:Protein kinase-like (Pk-like) n=1 Tax=Colletotrichum incanum TaxID=1573173 RepID=A0A161WBV2_COLIC|nr:protein kinase-like (pk-like) [Colletotrichum incanum]